MSAEQAYKRTELEDLLVAVVKTALAGQLPEEKIWIDQEGSGKKAGTHCRINTRRSRRRLTVSDANHYQAPETPGGDASKITVKRRVVGCAIDFFGPAGWDLAEELEAALQTSEIHELLGAKEVGLVGSVDGPISLPYTEDNERKDRSRLEFDLYTCVATTSPANYIERVELVNPQLGTHIIELKGADS